MRRLVEELAAASREQRAWALAAQECGAQECA
jgi:hypothetical protein